MFFQALDLHKAFSITKQILKDDSYKHPKKLVPIQYLEYDSK